MRLANGTMTKKRKTMFSGNGSKGSPNKPGSYPPELTESSAHRLARETLAELDGLLDYGDFEDRDSAVIFVPPPPPAPSPSISTLPPKAKRLALVIGAILAAAFGTARAVWEAFRLFGVLD